jgi:hypothetical protein
VPIVAQSDSTAFGIINGAGRPAFAINIDSPGGTKTARGVVNIYDRYDGNWHNDISLKAGGVGIGGASSPVGRMDIYDGGSFDPVAVALNHLSFGHVHAPNGWDATGMCSGDSSGGISVCNAANGSTWYWGAEDGTGKMNTTMYLNPTGDLAVTARVFAAGVQLSSDERLKTGVKTIDHALGVLERLRGVTFKWKSTGAESIGVIAQEVQKVLPQIVATDSAGFLSVDYTKLVGVLIESVKELKHDHERVAADNKTLAHENAALIARLDRIAADNQLLSTQNVALTARLQRLENAVGKLASASSNPRAHLAAR